MFQKFFSASFIMLVPFALLAHGSHGNGFLSGFTHPILGLDHAIAIAGVGVLAYHLNPAKWYFQVLAFVLAMIIGGLFGIDHEATFFIEKVIAFSVFAIGVIIAFNLKLNNIVLILILAIFGAFHGYAHGAEMSSSNTALKYVSGYAVGSLLVGTIGMLIAKAISSNNKKNQYYFNILGGSILGAGVVMLLS